MDKCLSNKILNPKTNRCVNKDGKIGKKIILMNGLKWSNNSCYIDSLLFAIKVSYPELFESDLREIKNGDEKIRDIQKRIKEEILNLIKNKNDNCGILRNLLNKFYNNLRKINPKINIIDRNENLLTSQLDIFQLMEILDYIFNFKNELKFMDGDNIIKTTFDINIPIDLLINKDKIKINKILPLYKIKYNLENGKTINKKFEILKTKKLMIKIYRNLGIKKLKTKIILSPYLKLKENRKRLKLTSIIIHYGNNQEGHYISLFKYNSDWYEYNDMSNKMNKIGKGLTNINNNDNYISNIVALLYS